MKHTNNTNSTFHQIAVKLQVPDYEKLLQVVGPHVKISSIIRELILKFIESQKKKAA